MFDYSYLLRKVNTSKKFDKYFQYSTCQFTPMGKGNTDKTMQVLKSETLKYQNQTQNLIEDSYFKTQNLKEFTNKVHTFLYNYFQYKPDDFNQNLKSPNCAYSTRFDGHDCKTFSLIGGTMLLNKGINYYYRKVQQLEDEAGEFSHVYIVVPKNQITNDLKQGYYVIDGTLPEQTEVQFINKKDTFMSAVKMPHFSLNAPATQNNAVMHVDNLLTKLELLGYNPQSLIRFKNALNYYTQSGIDPILRKAKNNNGIYVEDIFVPLIKNTTKSLGNPLLPIGDLSGIDLTYGGLDLSGLSDISNNLGNVGGGATGTGNTLGNILGGLGQLGNLQNGNIGDVATAGLDAWTGGLASTISGIIGLDLGDAINNIISGQWDCIGGSGWTKSSLVNQSNKLKGFADPIVAQLNNERDLTKIQDRLNLLSKGVNMFKDHWQSHLNTGWNSCSTKVLKNVVKLANPYLQYIESYLEKLRPYIFIESIQHSNLPARLHEVGINSKDRGYKYSWTEYKLTPRPQQNQGNNNQGNQNQGNQNNTNQQKSGSALPIVAGLALLAKVAHVF